MSSKYLALALILTVPALVAVAAEKGKEAQAKIAKRTVIVPQDVTPFAIEMRQMVRLTGQGISGSKIVADLEGPARIVAENSLVTMKDGHILIGMAKMEFEIRPTGQGTVKVKITSTPPQPNAEPTVTNYQFEVK
jgi:hypothetical protein